MKPSWLPNRLPNRSQKYRKYGQYNQDDHDTTHLQHALSVFLAFLFVGIHRFR